MGRPFLPNHEPFLSGNELKYVRQCIETNWVSSAGPFVDRFEAALARYVGSPHAVAVVNGTAALHVALRLVGVQPGDKVIVPALTFIASANAVRYCGADPVFIDADPATWQLDPVKVEGYLANECALRGGACVEKRSGTRVRAVMPVHLLGSSCDMVRLVALARRFRLKVVEDAAEGLGVRYRGRHVGTFGDVSAFSFNGNKIATAGGGGMIVTDDSKLASRARYLTTQAKDDAAEYIHNEVGFNYRITNLQAAVGLAQIERLDFMVAAKRRLATLYDLGLRRMQGVRAMPITPGCDPTYWLYTITLPPETKLTRRKEVIRRLNAAGIGARSLWHPLNTLPPYRRSRAYRVDVAPDLYARAISLPSGAGLSRGDALRCMKTLSSALN